MWHTCMSDCSSFSFIDLCFLLFAVPQLLLGAVPVFVLADNGVHALLEVSGSDVRGFFHCQELVATQGCPRHSPYYKPRTINC